MTFGMVLPLWRNYGSHSSTGERASSPSILPRFRAVVKEESEKTGNSCAAYASGTTAILFLKITVVLFVFCKIFRTASFAICLW